jgi:hypothetical protein
MIRKSAAHVWILGAVTYTYSGFGFRELAGLLSTTAVAFPPKRAPFPSAAFMFNNATRLLTQFTQPKLFFLCRLSTHWTW